MAEIPMCTFISPKKYKSFFLQLSTVTERKKNYSRLWAPGSVIKIAFIDGDDEQKKKKVQDVAVEWLEYAVGISFDFVKGNQGHIRISFKGEAAESLMGTDAIHEDNTKATMTLGALTNIKEDDREWRAIVLHEFGHAIGLDHEQQSPASIIPWNEEEVYRYYLKKYQWDKDKVYNCVIKKETSEINTRFDKLSIMEYPVDRTLTTDHSWIDYNYDLDGIDKTTIMSIYPLYIGPISVGDTVRFEAVGDPTKRLSQNSSNINLTARKDWGTDLGKSDSSFKVVRSKAEFNTNTYVSFQSIKNPNQYIRLKGSKFFLDERDPKNSTPSDTFNADSSFLLQFDPNGSYNVKIIPYSHRDNRDMALLPDLGDNAVLGKVPSVGNFKITVVALGISKIVDRKVHFELPADPTHRLTYESDSFLHLTKRVWGNAATDQASLFKVAPSNVRDTDLVSFQSLVNTKCYIRHKNNRFYVQEIDYTDDFDKDSSFKLVYDDNAENHKVGIQLYNKSDMLNLPAPGDSQGVCVVGSAIIPFNMFIYPSEPQRERERPPQ